MRDTFYQANFPFFERVRITLGCRVLSAAARDIGMIIFVAGICEVFVAFLKFAVAVVVSGSFRHRFLGTRAVPLVARRFFEPSRRAESPVKYSIAIKSCAHRVFKVSKWPNTASSPPFSVH